MTTKAYIGTADALYAGRAYESALYSLQGMKGRPVNLLTKVSLGSPIAPDANALIAAATDTELPNNTTITYTAGTTSSPCDDAGRPATTTIACVDGVAVTVWPLDVPRNISCVTTHLSSIVAMTVTITGYDKYRAKMVETITVAATGTNETDVGLKAFKYIRSIAITSTGNATANTLNVGWGDVLGLPYLLEEKDDVVAVYFNHAALVVASQTWVVGDATTATATTGDVRGTVDLASASDGSAITVWMHTSDTKAASARGLLGVVQYDG